MKQSNSNNNLTFSLVVFVNVMAGMPLCHLRVVVLDESGIRTALVVPVADGEDVGLVGLVWVNPPGFDVLAEFCFEFHVPLWTAGRHVFLLESGERMDVL